MTAFAFGSTVTWHPMELKAAPAPKEAKVQTQTAQQVVNLNKASLEELQIVRGIGPAIADRIMQYRQEHGRFEKLEDITQVKGIGEAKFQKIKTQITI